MSLDEYDADSNLSALESALAGLLPQPSRINRDRLLFEAGRAAEQSRTRGACQRWLFSSCVATVAAASFGILLLDTRAQLDRAQLDRAQLDRAQLDRAQSNRAQSNREHVAGNERPIAAAVPSTSADEAPLSERRSLRSGKPPASPQPAPVQAASGSVDTPLAAGKSAVVVQTSGGGQENYLALRNRALRLGIDALANASSEFAAHTPVRASDAPATNRELRQRYFDRSVRQPAVFESFWRGLPVFDGESS